MAKNFSGILWVEMARDDNQRETKLLKTFIITYIISRPI